MILPDWMIRERAMISPFCERSVHAETGMSFGLSSGGYDFRIKQNRTLNKGDFCIASTVERFQIPNDVMPFVVDKSTLARMGISIFNTCAEAGWEGWLTVEIVCHAPGPIRLIAGQPIGQMVFHQMAAPPERTYAGGKYDQQPNEPVGPRAEHSCP
jgi:dCTP deaminase